MRRRRLIAIGGLVMVGVATIWAFSGEKDFQGLLEYEAQNRAFALIWTRNAAHNADNPNEKEFWEAYHRLELLNQQHYAEPLAKHQIDQAPTRRTRAAVNVSEVILPIMPQGGLGFMRDSAESYVPKLERLKSLADADDAVYDYIIAQEQVQVTALTNALDGDFLAGARAFDAFVASNQID